MFIHKVLLLDLTSTLVFNFLTHFINLKKFLTKFNINEGNQKKLLILN